MTANRESVRTRRRIVGWTVFGGLFSFGFSRLMQASDTPAQTAQTGPHWWLLDLLSLCIYFGLLRCSRGLFFDDGKGPQGVGSVREGLKVIIGGCLAMGSLFGATVTIAQGWRHGLHSFTFGCLLTFGLIILTVLGAVIALSTPRIISRLRTRRDLNDPNRARRPPTQFGLELKHSVIGHLYTRAKNWFNATDIPEDPPTATDR